LPHETVSRIRAKIYFVMPLRNVQRPRQFTRPGAKAMDVIDSTPCSHDAEASPRLERANQNQPTPGRAFHEHIEHPVHTVIHVNVDCPRRVSLDERAGARPCKGVASFVIQSEIGLCLDYDA
jgi:hypothetical protein